MGTFTATMFSSIFNYGFRHSHSQYTLARHVCFLYTFVKNQVLGHEPWSFDLQTCLLYMFAFYTLSCLSGNTPFFMQIHVVFFSCSIFSHAYKLLTYTSYPCLFSISTFHPYMHIFFIWISYSCLLLIVHIIRIHFC